MQTLNQATCYQVKKIKSNKNYEKKNLKRYNATKCPVKEEINIVNYALSTPIIKSR